MGKNSFFLHTRWVPSGDLGWACGKIPSFSRISLGLEKSKVYLKVVKIFSRHAEGKKNLFFNHMAMLMQFFVVFPKHKHK